MNSGLKQFHLHLVSDATGETINSVARACVAQFDQVQPIEHFWNLVRTTRQLEMVIEGNYLDVVAYLKDLEALPWQFCWKDLELATVKYPVNRVRIEITTLSMDKEWLGV